MSTPDLAIPNGLTIVWDCIGPNLAEVSKIRPLTVEMAGYVTGNGIAWTAAQYAEFPNTIRIDQTSVSTEWDDTADVDDYENGAVALSELAPRAKARIAAFKNAKRPGQRMPLVYMSASRVTEVVNALIAGGVNSGVGLWVANWSIGEPTAIADVLNASGPFPIHGVQFSNTGLYDVSVFSTAWLNTRSGKASPPPVIPPKTIEQAGWKWCHRCQGLFWGPGENYSQCPAGGKHNGSESGTYTLQDLT